MYCEPLPSLKERVEKAGFEKEYRTAGLNRAMRRKDIISFLKPQAIKRKPKESVVNYSIIRREERKKEGILGWIKKWIKKLFRLK